MNIQDIHYNKYIKYKTKYLELKEQSGGMFGFLKSKSKAPVAPVAPIAYVAPVAPIAYVAHVAPIAYVAHVPAKEYVNNENQHYGEKAVKLMKNFFIPFETAILGDKNSSKRKSSKKDIEVMHSQIVQILNEIKNHNKNISLDLIKDLDTIINLIKNSCIDNLPHDKNKLSSDQNEIHTLLNKNKKISDFGSLKIVINTYFNLMNHCNSGNYTESGLEGNKLL
jgi:hypothetical protein